MMKNWLIAPAFFLFFCLLFACESKNPVAIRPFAPEPPTASPMFNRGDIKLNGSFAPGYQNGLLRSNQVALQWAASVEESFASYRIFRDDVLLQIIPDRNMIQYTDTSGIQPNQFYNYKIALFNQQGLFLSDTIRVKTPEFDAPDNIDYQILGQSGTVLRLFWQNNAESASEFRVYRKLASTGDSAYAQIGTTVDTTLVDNFSLISGETYDYQITAFNAFEETPRSVPATIAAVYDLSPPSLATVQQITPGRAVRIRWTDASNAEDGFHIWRRSGAATFALVGTVGTNQQTFTDADTTGSLHLDTTYTYAVSAFDITGDSPLSNEMSLTIRAPSNFTGYTNSFEDSLGSEWTFFSSQPDGRIILSAERANTGQFMLLMDVAVDGILNLNQATLSMDLSGVNAADKVMLNFFYNTFDDEVSPLEELVQISSDGQNWETVYIMQVSPFVWTKAEINLQDFTGTQPYSATYQVRWQQQDNFPFPTDGIGIDDVEIVLLQ